MISLPNQAAFRGLKKVSHIVWNLKKIPRPLTIILIVIRLWSLNDTKLDEKMICTIIIMHTYKIKTNGIERKNFGKAARHIAEINVLKVFISKTDYSIVKHFFYQLNNETLLVTYLFISYWQNKEYNKIYFTSNCWNSISKLNFVYTLLEIKDIRTS